MKLLSVLILMFVALVTQAQVVGTPYVVVHGIDEPLDVIADNPTFAFSTRKLRTAYAGFAMRVRNASNSAEADVSFDTNGEVSSTSSIAYTAAGSSGQSVGSTSTLSSFKGSAQLFVTRWYDQSSSGRNAQQVTTSAQPELLLATQKNHAVLSFNGTQNIPVAATAIQLLGTTSGGVQGVLGTLLLVTKVTGNNNPESFGLKDASNARFQSHLNWSDGNLYFDAGEVCCSGTRLFNNSSSLNLWKQYTMQRQDLVKLVNVSGVNRLSGNGNAAAQPNTTFFGIGGTNNAITAGYIGQISEFVLFNKALTSEQIKTFENNQMTYWNSY